MVKKEYLVKDYTKIPLDIVRKNNMTHQEAILFEYLLSLPDFWDIDRQVIIKDLDISLSSLKRYLKGLEKKHYLKIHRRRNRNTKKIELIYKLYNPNTRRLIKSITPFEKGTKLKDKFDIVRHNVSQTVTKKYARIPNAMLKDSSLSMHEKRLMSYLYSLPEFWYVSRYDLANNLNVSKSTISRYIKTLKKKGYLKTEVVELSYSEYLDYNFTLYCPNSFNLDYQRKYHKHKFNPKFNPPKLIDLQNHMALKNLEFVKPEKFLNYYEKHGWRKIKDWRKKLEQWDYQDEKKEERKRGVAYG